MVGNDLIPNERKFGNTYYDAFQGICLVASNESIAFGDHSDALYRRRCVVPFNRVVPDHEIAAFYDAGGEEQLFAELPGLTNKLLAISESEIRATLSNPPPVVMEANHEEEQSANPISRWVFECLVPSPQSSSALSLVHNRKSCWAFMQRIPSQRETNRPGSLKRSSNMPAIERSPASFGGVPKMN